MSISSILTMLLSILLSFLSWLRTTPAEAVFVVILKVDVGSTVVLLAAFSSIGAYSSVEKNSFLWSAPFSCTALLLNGSALPVPEMPVFKFLFKNAGGAELEEAEGRGALILGEVSKEGASGPVLLAFSDLRKDGLSSGLSLSSADFFKPFEAFEAFGPFEDDRSVSSFSGLKIAFNRYSLLFFFAESDLEGGVECRVEGGDEGEVKNEGAFQKSA